MKKFVRAVFLNDNKVLLIKEKKAFYDAWNLPGGKVDDGETPKDAILREVKEEINLEPLDIDFMFDVKCNFGGEEWQGYYFISKNTDVNSLKILEPTKCYGYCFFEFNELNKYDIAIPDNAFDILKRYFINIL